MTGTAPPRPRLVRGDEAGGQLLVKDCPGVIQQRQSGYHVAEGRLQQRGLSGVNVCEVAVQDGVVLSRRRRMQARAGLGCRRFKRAVASSPFSCPSAATGVLYRRRPAPFFSAERPAAVRLHVSSHIHLRHLSSHVVVVVVVGPPISTKRHTLTSARTNTPPCCCQCAPSIGRRDKGQADGQQLHPSPV
jgi:hypothetical protein